MSRFRHVELQYASRLLNHGPTILITSYDAPSDRRNVMAAAWSMPVEFAPPRVAIVVDKSTWTREIIERNGTFGIVVPGVAAAMAVDHRLCGVEPKGVVFQQML